MIAAYRKTKGFTGKQCGFLSFNNRPHHVRYGFVTRLQLKISTMPKHYLYQVLDPSHFYPYYSTSVSFPCNKTTTTLSFTVSGALVQSSDRWKLGTRTDTTLPCQASTPNSADQYQTLAPILPSMYVYWYRFGRNLHHTSSPPASQ